jgi:hypothetical protein
MIGCGSNLDICDVLISDNPVERSGPPEAKFPVVVRIDYNLLPCQWHEASSPFLACMVGSSGEGLTDEAPFEGAVTTSAP